jgi:hypothetical protein
MDEQFSFAVHRALPSEGVIHIISER